MSGFEIRAMTAADVGAACELAHAQGFRDRQRFYDFVLRTSTCRPLVGTIDGSLVATGLATVSLPVGWIGAIVVLAEQRRRGFGRAMTEEVCQRLRSAGCATLSLEATDSGRPMYERMGFRLATCYHQLQADHLTEAPTPPEGSRIRRLEPADLTDVFALDLQATGEDRHVALEFGELREQQAPRRRHEQQGQQHLPGSHRPDTAKREADDRDGRPDNAGPSDGTEREHHGVEWVRHFDGAVDG